MHCQRLAEMSYPFPPSLSPIVEFEPLTFLTRPRAGKTFVGGFDLVVFQLISNARIRLSSHDLASLLAVLNGLREQLTILRDRDAQRRLLVAQPVVSAPGEEA